MKRDIVCADCFTPHVIDPLDSYRYYNIKKGPLTVTCLCDLCGTKLRPGDTVNCCSYAFTIEDYWPWETEFIKL